jgi:TonB family protein
MLTACYEKSLMRAPSLTGKVVVEVVVAENGTVSTARIHQSTVNNAEVEPCIVERFKRMRFPNAHQGGGSVVQFPLVLTLVTCTRQGVHSRCSP